MRSDFKIDVFIVWSLIFVYFYFQTLKQLLIALIKDQIGTNKVITQSEVYFIIKGGILPSIIDCLFTQLSS